MPVYLDHAATTPLHPEVRDAFLQALETVGNPSSIHAHGQQARAVLEDARERVARQLDCDSAEVVFTSGGTESINLGIKGLFWRRQQEHERPVVLAAEGEHHATVEALEWLERQGADVRWLKLDALGRLLPDVLSEALAAVDPDHVALITVMWANNEVGTVQPIASLANVADEFGIPMHVDGVAALGQEHIQMASLTIAALSLSAHKIGGPVGLGVLVLSRQWEVEPLLHGGDQQRGRSGTMDVAGAVAFATALELSQERREPHLEHLRALQAQLIAGVREAIPDAVLRGAPEGQERLPSNVHFTFPGCQGDSLLFLLDQRGFSVSTGSACHAGVAEVSHVLIAMGIDEETALGALRFTLGETNTAEQIDELVSILPELVALARQAGVNTAS
jgi:cysteine desulfurase